MKRNRHNLTHSQLWTAKLGKLYPIDIMPVNPTDRIVCAVRNFVRFSPLVAPAMTMIKQNTHSWYVPTWLLWDEFEDFITGKDETLRVPKARYPQMVDLAGTLWDYFGLPVFDGMAVPTDAIFKVDILPFKAFWMIYDFYYRDEDLMVSPTFEERMAILDKWQYWTESGFESDRPTTEEFKMVLTLPNVAWAKDNYTTARPWQQKGSAVTVPLASSGLTIKSNGAMVFKSSGSPNSQGNAVFGDSPSGEFHLMKGDNQSLNLRDIQYYSGLVGETSGMGVNINELALASALARRRFKDAKYGSRYAELLQSLGANSADARIHMPQFLGGSSDVMQISEVVQTSQSTDTSSLGDMGGHGIGTNTGRPWKREFNEHGYIISLSFFRPDAVYLNQTERDWFNDIREDYYFPEFENVGLREVLSQELSRAARENEIFGYQDNYYWMRRRNNRVVGDFRKLDKHWHLARDFGSDVPALNASFVTCSPSNRIFADLVNDTLKIQSTIHLQAYRRLSKSAKLRL